MNNHFFCLCILLYVNVDGLKGSKTWQPRKIYIPKEWFILLWNEFFRSTSPQSDNENWEYCGSSYCTGKQAIECSW